MKELDFLFVLLYAIYPHQTVNIESIPKNNCSLARSGEIRGSFSQLDIEVAVFFLSCLELIYYFSLEMLLISYNSAKYIYRYHL